MCLVPSYGTNSRGQLSVLFTYMNTILGYIISLIFLHDTMFANVFVNSDLPKLGLLLKKYRVQMATEAGFLHADSALLVATQ